MFKKGERVAVWFLNQKWEATVVKFIPPKCKYVTWGNGKDNGPSRVEVKVDNWYFDETLTFEVHC